MKILYSLNVEFFANSAKSAYAFIFFHKKLDIQAKNQFALIFGFSNIALFIE